MKKSNIELVAKKRSRETDTTSQIPQPQNDTRTTTTHGSDTHTLRP